MVDREMGLRCLWQKLETFCKDSGLSKPWGASFTLNSIGVPEGKVQYPELSSHFKASAVTTIMRFVAHISFEFELVATEASRMRRANAWAFGEIQFILDMADWRLSPREVRRFDYASNLYLLSYQWLATDAINQGVLMWKVRPKHHYFCHLVDRTITEHLNPCKFLQNAAEESYMGVVKKIGKQCHGKSVYTRLIQRLVLFLGIRWKRRAESGTWNLRAR